MTHRLQGARALLRYVRLVPDASALNPIALVSSELAMLRTVPDSVTSLNV